VYLEQNSSTSRYSRHSHCSGCPDEKIKDYKINATLGEIISTVNKI
jgi:hypothetical protein